MDIVQAFGFVLRKHRKNSGLSQEQLALRCDLDRTFIGLLERAQRQPSLTTIFKIAEQLDLEPHRFILEVEETYRMNEVIEEND